MNRRNYFFKMIVVTTFLFLGLQVFNSCKKDDVVLTTEDVIDTAPAVKAKDAILSATTLATLPAEIKTAATAISSIVSTTQIEKFNSVSYVDVAQFYQTNTTLSAAEVTALKANDAATFTTVIKRMLSTPSFTSMNEIKSIREAMATNAATSAFVIKNIDGTEELYTGEYYQGALDVQKTIQTNVIPAFQKIGALQATGTKSASTLKSILALTDEEKRLIATTFLMTITAVEALNEMVQTTLLKLAQEHIGG